MKKLLAGTITAFALLAAGAPIAQAADQSVDNYATTAPSSYGKA
jgi:hypothetical protein